MSDIDPGNRALWRDKLRTRFLLVQPPEGKRHVKRVMMMMMMILIYMTI